MAARRLQASIWHLFIIGLLGVLITTGCGRSGADDAEAELTGDEVAESGINFDPSQPRTYAAAGNISPENFQAQLSQLPPNSGVNIQELMNVLNLLRDKNASEPELQQALASAYRQLYQVAMIDSLRSRQVMNQLIAQLNAKMTAVKKEKRTAVVMSGLKDMLKMVIGAVINIIGMFKK